MPFTTSFFSSSTHSSTKSSPLDALANAREFITDKLYYLNVVQQPTAAPGILYFTIDNLLIYANFFEDFGPLNIANVFRFCDMMSEKLHDASLASKKICLFSSMDKAKRANSAFLLCAFMMLALRQTPDQAYAPLVDFQPPFINYRDAGYGAATYHLSIYDILKGFYKSMQVGLFHIDRFDVQEYEFYEKVEHGDFNWITEKFLALASPKDDCNALTFNVNRTGAPLKTLFGNQCYSAYKKADLIRFLKERNIMTIVRLNNNVYDRADFIEAGIEHIELYFPDGSTPPDNILKRFLDLCESREGAIAVHCKAGLGRTGSLIGAYLMKHYRLTASECISFLRVIRPGSVVGPQQNWLERYKQRINGSMQAKIWRMTPSAPLNPMISLKQESTLRTSGRWLTPTLQSLIEKINAKNRISNTEESVYMDAKSERFELETDEDARPYAGPTSNDSYNRTSLGRKSKPSNKQQQPQQAPQQYNTNPATSFSLDEYVIPVQPRKGKRTINQQDEEQLFQTRQMQTISQSSLKSNSSNDAMLNSTATRYPLYVAATSNSSISNDSFAQSQTSIQNMSAGFAKEMGKGAASLSANHLPAQTQSANTRQQGNKR